MSQLIATKEYDLKSEINSLKKIITDLKEILPKTALHSRADQIVTVAREAISNAIIHGNESNCHKRIKVSIRSTPEALHLEVEDQGKGFDSDEVPNPLDEENIGKDTGRGIFIIKKFADHVIFNEKGNRITIVFFSDVN